MLKISCWTIIVGAAKELYMIIRILTGAVLLISAVAAGVAAQSGTARIFWLVSAAPRFN
jgi:hypothetical protein